MRRIFARILSKISISFSLLALTLLGFYSVAFSAIYTGGSDDGFDQDIGTTYDIVEIASENTQITYKDDGTTSYDLLPITITQVKTAPTSTTAPINSTNNIRIIIPDSLSLVFDTSITSLTATGSAVDNSKISSTPSVTYEQDGTGNYRIAVINVDADFADGEWVRLSGIKVKNATTIGYNYLYLSVDGGSTKIARDPYRIMVQYPPAGLTTGGQDDGYDDAIGSNFDLVWISSENTQIFYQGDPATETLPITIELEHSADPTAPAINTTSDIRIVIPSTLSAEWDPTVTTITVSGNAASKVSTTVSYENTNKTVVIDVTTDFADGDYITISGLKMTNFTSVGYDYLGIDITNTGTIHDTDDYRTVIQYKPAHPFTGGQDDGFDQQEHYHPITLYRSVGTTATDLNTVSATVEITTDGVTTTATFSAPLPENIGPGDVLQWYDSGTSTYKIAFITKRITSTQFYVQSADGSQAPTTPAGTSVSIYRAYTSLNNFNLQDENDSLDDTVEDFDTTKDLVTNELSYEVICYPDGTDTTPATISGWTTSPSTYIRIASSAAHNGQYGSNYTLQPSTGVALTIKSDHIRVKGLSISSPDSDAVQIGPIGANADIRLINNIIKGNTTDPAYGVKITTAGSGAKVILANNIIYDFTGSTASAIYWNDTNTNLTLIAYNNTLKDCSRGFQRENDSTHYIKNNVIDTTDAFYGTFLDDDTHNDYNFISENNSSEVAIGTHGGYNLTFTYQDEPNDNFKLSSSDTSAKDKATDLSTDSQYAFFRDIDEQGRGNGDGWDAGADEVPVDQYRSVGITTTDLNTGSATVQITGTTATFSAALPDNIGIGDVLQYDGDGDSQMDIAIITRRLSPTQFEVHTPSGGTPVSAPSGTSVSIYRAYTSLENAGNLDENDSLDDTIEDFDTQPNLIWRNATLHLVCYADGTDTTPATIDFTTDQTNYVKIYTPYHDYEVGTSQRHWGTWASSGYSLSTTGATALTLNTYKAQIDGLKISSAQAGANTVEVGDTCRDIQISRSLIKGDWDGSVGNDIIGITATIPEGTLKIWNNILYNYKGSGSAKAINLNLTNGTAYLYNNTIYAVDTGINAVSGTVVAKNNLVQSASDGYAGTFDSTSDYNLSNLDSDAPNATYTTGSTAATVSFVNTTAGSEDLHLSSSDIAAKDQGIDLSSDSNLSFHKDVDSLSRYDGSWDIGADEESNNGYVVWDGGGADNNWSTAQNWSNDTVPSTGTKVFFDDWSVKDSTWDGSGPAEIKGLVCAQDYTGTLTMARDVTIDTFWKYYGSNFSAGSYKITLDVDESHFSFIPGGMQYYDLSIANGPWDVYITGTASVAHNLILAGGYATELIDGTIQLYGDLLITSTNCIGGTTLIKLVGTGDQTIDSSGGWLPSVEIDKPSGTLHLVGTINIRGDWTWTNGTLDAGTSKLRFVANDEGYHSNFTPGSVHYYNLQISQRNYDFYVNGTAYVDNDLIIDSYGTSAEVYGGTIEVEGDVRAYTDTGEGGTTVIKLTGSGDQTIYSEGRQLPSIEIAKPSGMVYLSGERISLQRNWIWTSGDGLDPGTTALRFEGGADSYFTPGPVRYWSLELHTGNYGTFLQGDLYLMDRLTYVSPYNSSKLTTNGHTIVCREFSLSTGNFFYGDNSTIIIKGGNFIHSGGTFSNNNGTVILEGGDQYISGSTTFYNLVKHCANACTLTFDAGSTTTVTHELQLSGRPEGRRISLRSSTEGSQYTINVDTPNGAVYTVEYADIKDANFTNAITAAASVDSGNNTNLTITKEFICEIKSSGGDYTSLSSWASAVACDLTASTTKVFSHSGIVGTISDGASVTGATSGATGTVVHCTDDQILIKNISGTFQSGEQVQVDASNYVTITDDGHGAVATAYLYDDWPTGLSDTATIDGTAWTTDQDNFISIYVPTNQRHNGKVKEGTNYSGFAIVGSGTQLNITTPYTRVEGIIFDDPDDATNAISISADNVKISHNIFNGFNGSYNAITIGANTTEHIHNNILINSNINISDTASGPIYLYNNTIYQGVISAGTSGKVIVKNTIGYNTTSAPFTGTFDSASDYNLSNDTSAPGANSLKNITLSQISFKDTTAGSEDLHIYRSSQARNNATDLSTDLNSWVVDDIDQSERVGLWYWDIGADEASGVVKKRSVGITATALATDNSGANTLTISGTTATFSSALSDNIGIGDVIQYDSDGDSSVDSLAIITERTSSTQYEVIAPDGETQPTATTNSTTWQIYRAYTSLFNWASQSQNTNITAGTLDTTKDLVSDESIAEAICYADGADSSAVSISGFTTSPDYYIKIYTPTQTNQVGTSQRHQGTWSSGGYSLEVSNATALTLAENDIEIDGLRLSVAQTDGQEHSAIEITATTPNITIKNCIIKSDNTDNLTGINFETGSGGTLKIYNNILHDFAGANSTAINLATSTDVYLYNNTVYHATTGINAGSSGTVVAKNNLVQDCSADGYNGTFNTASDHNLSDTTDDAPNSTFTPGVGIVEFTDSANRNLNIAGWPDWAAIDKGEDLSSDPNCPVTTDILGSPREEGLYDIGAFEYQGTTVTSTASGRWTNPSIWNTSYVPTPKDNVVIASGTEVSYDVGNLLYDDFESGNFLNYGYERIWDWSTGGADPDNSKTFISSPTYYGNYAVKYVFGGTDGSNVNYRGKTFSNKYTYYIRFYFYLESESLSADAETNVAELTQYTDTNVRGVISVYKSSTDNLYLKAYYYDGSGLQAFTNMAPIQTGKWYLVEYYQKADGTGAGEAKFWVNGSLIAQISGLTNDDARINKFYLGQKNGTNDDAITYIIDEVAVDSGYRNYTRPTNTLDTTKPYHYDYQIKSLTVNSTGSLETTRINTVARQHLWLYGDLSISGTLTLNYALDLFIKSDTQTQHGIIVNSGGKFITDGYLRPDPRLLISAVNQDGSHNTYILCQDGSTCRFVRTEFSYLGSNTTDKYGVTAKSLDPETASEGIVLQYSNLHNIYQPIRLESVNNALIYGNIIHDSTYGIYLTSSNNNLISHNDIYTLTNPAITLDSSNTNVLYANVIYDIPTAIHLTGTSSYNRIYNQTISTATSTGINLTDANQTSNQIKNTILHSCATAISDSGTSTTIDHNLFYNNTSDGSTGTNATTGVDPSFISTSPSDTTFFYLNKNSPALGAGIDLFDGLSPGTVNYGARLGFVKNVTDNNLFNYINAAANDADTSDGDTITTYANDILQSTFSGDGLQLSQDLVKIAVPEEVITADGDLVGDYIFIEAGQNFGYYYPIVASKEDTTDTITIYSPNHPASTFHTNDKFTVVDRVYGWKKNDYSGYYTCALIQKDLTVNTTGKAIITSIENSYGFIVGSGSSTDPVHWARIQGYNFVDLLVEAIRVGPGNYHPHNDGIYILDNTFASDLTHSTTSSRLALENADSLDEDRSANGALVQNNTFHYASLYIIYHSDHSTIKDNLFINSYYGIDFGEYLTVCLFKDNTFLGGTRAIGRYNSTSTFKHAVVGNLFLGQSERSIDCVGSAVPNWRVFNNLFIDDENGIYAYNSGASNWQVRDNVFAYCQNGIGYGGGGATLSEDFNYYYQNGTNYYSTLGSNSIVGTSDPFKYTSLGTADATSTTTMIYIPSANWTDNQYQGWGVKIESGGSVYWAGVYSNTKDRLYLAPALDIEPDNLTVNITDFSLVPNAEPLGQGCKADGSTEPGYVNMGASLGFVKNETDSTIFNTIQDAATDSNLSAGDLLKIYAVEESSGTVGAVEDLGPFAKITLYNSTAPTSEGTITADDQYDGMYLYFTSGADKGKYYLIADCAEIDTDTDKDDLIIIVCEDPSNIHTGDTFVIVDRIYDRIDGALGTDTANAVLSVDGTADNPITWQAEGRVVIDGKDSATYGLAINGADYQVIDGLDIQNSTSYGIYATGPATGLYIKDNLIHHTGKGIGTSLTTSIIENNQLYQITNDPINLESTSTNTILSHNKIWTTGQQVSVGGSQSTAVLNQFLNTGLTLQASQSVAIKNLIYRKPLTLTGTGSENRIWNNTIYRSDSDGIYIGTSQTKNKLRNNMLISNAEAGIDDDNPSTTEPNDIDFNLYLSNTATYEGTGTRGSNERELTTLTLKARESGTVGSGSTAMMIVDTSKSWVNDMFAGMILKLTDGSSNTYYAPILSNTKQRIYLASTLGYTPAGDGTETYEVIDLSVAGTSASDTNTSLGTGCASDGTTTPGTVNIGWITDFVKNVTDSLKFNSMQDAHDDASLSAGDTITTYAHNEYENATIGSTITDLGPFVKLEIAEEEVVSVDDQYNGMYIFIEAGENYGRHYLIVDTDERTSADDGTDVDTITILAPDPTTFHTGDKFTVVDRVYERWGGLYAGYWEGSNRIRTTNLRITKDGDILSPITFNTAGRTIIDPRTYYAGIADEDGNYIRISNFAISSSSDPDDIPSSDYAGGIYLDGFATHVIVQDCLIGVKKNHAVLCVDSAGTDGYRVLLNNIAIGRPEDQGVLTAYKLAGNRWLVMNDQAYDFYEGGVWNYSGKFALIKGNRLFGFYSTGLGKGCGVYMGASYPRNSTVTENICLKGHYGMYWAVDQAVAKNNVLVDNYYGFWIYNDDNKFTNTIFLANSNGNFATNGTYTNTISNNFFADGSPSGTNYISGYDPNFRVLESGTVSAGTTTTMIKDTTKSWTPNQWQGYGVKVSVGGTTYWAGIYSNTADTLYITPSLGATPTADTDTYQITDFSINPTTSDTTPLGQGCLADGSTEPGYVNIGAHLEFAKLNDGTKYNSLKQALDSATDGYSVSIGSYVYVQNAVVKAVTNLGTMTKIDIDDSYVPESNYYDGMYLIVRHGSNAHKAYLIVDTVENDPNADNVDDSIYIFTDFTDGFSAGDVIDIVDRVYNYGTTDKAVELKATGLSNQQTLLSAYSTQYWYAGSLDFEDPIDYAIYDSVVGGCQCTELMNFYPVNYTTLTGGTNSPARVGDSYFYPCSSCYMDLLMRARNYFVEEGVLIKCGINEDYD